MKSRKNGWEQARLSRNLLNHHLMYHVSVACWAVVFQSFPSNGKHWPEVPFITIHSVLQVLFCVNVYILHCQLHLYKHWLSCIANLYFIISALFIRFIIPTNNILWRKESILHIAVMKHIYPYMWVLDSDFLVQCQLTTLGRFILRNVNSLSGNIIFLNLTGRLIK